VFVLLQMRESHEKEKSTFCSVLLVVFVFSSAFSSGMIVSMKREQIKMKADENGMRQWNRGRKKVCVRERERKIFE
jgi:hypothetical protein